MTYTWDSVTFDVKSLSKPETRAIQGQDLRHAQTKYILQVKPHINRPNMMHKTCPKSCIAQTDVVIENNAVLLNLFWTLLKLQQHSISRMCVCVCGVFLVSALTDGIKGATHQQSPAHKNRKAGRQLLPAAAFVDVNILELIILNCTSEEATD